jgi:hypothetical protein
MDSGGKGHIVRDASPGNVLESVCDQVNPNSISAQLTSIDLHFEAQGTSLQSRRIVNLMTAPDGVVVLVLLLIDMKRTSSSDDKALVSWPRIAWVSVRPSDLDICITAKNLRTQQILDFGPVSSESFISDFGLWTREQLKLHLFETLMSQLPNHRQSFGTRSRVSAICPIRPIIFSPRINDSSLSALTISVVDSNFFFLAGFGQTFGVTSFMNFNPS